MTEAAAVTAPWPTVGASDWYVGALAQHTPAGHPGDAGMDLRPDCATNLPVLNAFADASALDFYAVGPSAGIPHVGTVRFGGEITVDSGPDGMAVAALSAVLDIMPVPPWPTCEVYVTDQQWPRAVSVPGGIFVSKSQSLASYTTQLLYLPHELLHQWFGNCAVAATPVQRATMESWLDALVWRVVGDRIPRTEAVFAKLFHQSVVTDHRRRLDQVGLDRFAELAAGYVRQAQVDGRRSDLSELCRLTGTVEE
jgi:hypothetical protein